MTLPYAPTMAAVPWRTAPHQSPYMAVNDARALSYSYMPYASCHAYQCLPMPAAGDAACLPMPYALFLDCDNFNIMLNRGMPKKVMGLRLVVGRPIDLWQRMVGLWL